VTAEVFKDAVSEVYVAHCKTGYSSNWYDVEGDLSLPSLYSVNLPAKDGDVYVSIDPFYSEMMTWAVPSSFLFVTPGFKVGWEANPSVIISESEYEAGDNIGITSWVSWWGVVEDSSYTVRVYSKQDLEVQNLWG